MVDVEYVALAAKTYGGEAQENQSGEWQKRWNRVVKSWKDILPIDTAIRGSFYLRFKQAFFLTLNLIMYTDCIYRNLPSNTLFVVKCLQATLINH